MKLNTKTRLLLFLAFLFVGRVSAQNEFEALIVPWPTDYHWKTVNHSQTNGVLVTEMIPGNELEDQWSIMTVQMSLPAADVLTMKDLVELFEGMSQATAEDPKTTLLQDGETAATPFCLFSITSKMTRKTSRPESNLYYLVRIENRMLLAMVAIPKGKLPKKFIKKWTKILMASEIGYCTDIQEH